MIDATTEITEKIPLRMDETGTIRVGGTRVTLDVVIGAWDQGYAPEQIAYSFGSLKLDDIYAVLTYCLRHQEEVRAYLAQREKEANALRKEIESRPGHKEFRERLQRMKRERQGESR